MTSNEIRNALAINPDNGRCYWNGYVFAEKTADSFLLLEIAAQLARIAEVLTPGYVEVVRR